MDDLEPTGNCYEDAAMEITMFGSHEGWTLVHGRPVLQRPPYIRYGHAWLESPGGTMCWDPNTKTLVSKSMYYKEGQILEEECFRYTLEDLRRWITETGHWGPWEGVEGCGPLESACAK